MKLEVGKTYFPRGLGPSVLITHLDSSHPVSIYHGDNGKVYYPNGNISMCQSSSDDLIGVSITSAPDPTITLVALNAAFGEGEGA